MGTKNRQGDVAVLGWTEPIKKGGHGVCEDSNRSIALPKPTREVAILVQHAAQLLKVLSPEPSRIRGMGLSVRMDTKAAESGQATLQSFFQAGSGMPGKLQLSLPLEFSQLSFFIYI